MATGLTGKVEAALPAPLSPALSRKRARGIRSRFASFTLITWLVRAWRALRELSGDDAYERYLAHHTAHHAETKPLSRGEYFRRCEREKWEGVRRCC